MSRLLYAWGRWAAHRPWTVIAAWIVVSIFVIGASAAFGQKLEDSFAVPGLDSQKAIDLETAAHSDRAGLTAELVVTPLDGRSFSESASARQALARLEESVSRLPHVLGTNDPGGALAQGAPDAVSTGSLSADGRVAVLRIQYPVVEQLGAIDLTRLKQLGEAARVGSPLRIEMRGDLFAAFDKGQTNVGELIGLIAAVIILLLAFGSVVAMGLPIGMALFGLALGISSLSLVTYLVDVPSWAPVVGSMLGLGVGIDYALFLVTRHREFLGRGMTVEESVGRAVATAGQSVIYAGGTVVIAILGLSVAGIPFLTAAGVAISVIVFIMVIASVTLLPAFLGLAGHRINGLGRRGQRVRSARTDRATGAGWERWGRHVSRHPWGYVIGVTALLLALAAPVFALRLGFPDDGTLPHSRTERRSYDLVADGFGPGVNGPLVIAVDISADRDVVPPLLAAVRADRGIASVAPAEISADGRVATLLAFPTTAPQDKATLETVHRLRNDVFPQVLAGTPAQAHVGGQTASWADIGNKVGRRLPLFIVAVVFLSFVLLALVFRSVLVPLKAALLNLLSIGAAYGVIVMVFQWGWGKNLIGLESTVPTIAFIPMFMFAILFGLSMDYEVFLLSRIKEEYRLSKDNVGSVIRGISSTARVITSAALIMIAVFLGFVLGEDPATKMMGLGLATAIFLDATVVRLVLVPATMTILGDAAWWFPARLDRLLPSIDGHSEALAPQPTQPVVPETPIPVSC
jgi:RND superfamily putative drug exporter